MKSAGCVVTAGDAALVANTAHCADDVLLKRTPETYILPLTNVAPVKLLKKKNEERFQTNNLSFYLRKLDRIRLKNLK